MAPISSVGSSRGADGRGGASHQQAEHPGAGPRGEYPGHQRDNDQHEQADSADGHFNQRVDAQRMVAGRHEAPDSGGSPGRALPKRPPERDGRDAEEITSWSTWKPTSFRKPARQRRCRRRRARGEETAKRGIRQAPTTAPRRTGRTRFGGSLYVRRRVIEALTASRVVIGRMEAPRLGSRGARAGARGEAGVGADGWPRAKDKPAASRVRRCVPAIDNQHVVLGDAGAAERPQRLGVVGQRECGSVRTTAVATFWPPRRGQTARQGHQLVKAPPPRPARIRAAGSLPCKRARSTAPMASATISFSPGNMGTPHTSDR